VTFELGVNYWPRRSAMYMWREFDAAEIRNDMQQIADIGFDVVRIFALTQDFLPQPLTVEPEMIARLVEVVCAVSEARLKVVPTLIVINMSGCMWWPDWMMDSAGRPGDIYSDPNLLRSQIKLVEACATALRGNTAIRAFDVANEIDDAQRPHSREAGAFWASVLATTIREAGPGIPVRLGAHLPSLTTDNNMRIDDLARVVDEDVMHAYPLYSDAARSFLDPELVPFSCALTADLGGRGRAPLMQEFGLCTAAPGSSGQTIVDDFLGQPREQYLASEDEAAEYYHAVLEKLIRIGAAGAYAWCYGDYDSRLFHRLPLATARRERTFGLVRADGREKPAAAVWRSIRKRRDGGRLSPSADDTKRALDISADDYYCNPDANFKRLYARWLSSDGVRSICTSES
jgi:endo-1,4-beta-mannosidase